MSNVQVQKARQSDQPGPLLKDTIDLLNNVRDRAFELFQRRGGISGSDMDDWLQAEREVFQVPRMELTEKDGEFQVQVAVPGFDATDLRVVAIPNAVTVEGEACHQHRGMQDNVRICEFGERKIFRQIQFPESVDVDRVSATVDKGLLKIRAVKAESDHRRGSAA